MAQKVTNINESTPEIISGSFRFRSGEKFKAAWQISKEQLIEVATTLVEQNPGGGVFHKVWIRDTGPDELGICIIYVLGPVDLKHWSDKLVATGSHSSHNYLKKYADFFKGLRNGKSFKGWDFGQGMTELALE